MKRAVLTTAALGSASASALSVGKLVAVGLCSAIVGSVAAVGVTHVLSHPQLPAHASVQRVSPAPMAPAHAPEAPPTRESPPQIASPRAPATVLSPAPVLPSQSAVPAVPRPTDAPRARSDALVTPEILSGHGVGHAVPADESSLSLEVKLVREAADAVDAKDFEAAVAALRATTAACRVGRWLPRPACCTYGSTARRRTM